MEITIEKGDGSTFSPETGGDQRKSATIQVYLKLKSGLVQASRSCVLRSCMDSGCYRWIFSTSDSREFRKTGKVVCSNLNLMFAKHLKNLRALSTLLKSGK